jgi:hypothetical protein
MEDAIHALGMTLQEIITDVGVPWRERRGIYRTEYTEAGYLRGTGLKYIFPSCSTVGGLQ